jgi:single-stranded DNA-specific DHH superfamily exonuclease
MRAIAFAAIMLLTACSKEAAVNRGLVDAGIASPAASCMAREMAERLSVEQLQKLSRVADGSGKSLAEMSVADYIAAARRVGDAEVILVTGAAAAYCDAL